MGENELFTLGQVVATRGIDTACKEDLDFSREVHKAFLKYISGNWGETCAEDSALNDSAVQNNNDRIVAKYATSKGNIFIITEHDRSYTTILFANEY